MRKNSLKNLFGFIVGIGFAAISVSQTTISTAGNFTNNNGSGTVTFNFQNTNAYAVKITGVSGVVGTTDANSVCEVWFKTSAINGAPGAISNANGWTLAMSSTFSGVSNTATTTLQTFLTNGTFEVPAGVTYGFAICAKNSSGTGTQRYHTMTGNLTLNGGGVNMIFGTNVSYGGGAPPTAPTFTPRGWIGSLTFEPATIPSPNDAGITAILSPLNYCSGDNNALTINLKNFGLEQLDSCLVVWSVNSNVDSAWFVVNLDTVGGSGPIDTVLFLDSVSSTGAMNIVAYTRWPNGIADTSNLNDTATFSISGPAMEGTYVIGTGGGADYATFTAAVADLNTRGVCDDVIFNVQTGTYTEQIQINQLVGSSEDATVTFKSLTGNPADVNLTFAGTSTTNMHVVKFNGADWVTFKDMTITNTGTSFCVGFEYASGSNYNTVDGCSVMVVNGTSTNMNAVRMFPAVTTGNTFKNGVFSGGYYTFYCYSGSTTSFGYDLTIENNTISTGYIYSVYVYSYRNSKINGNIVTANTGSIYMYGIYLLYSDMSEITGNYIYSTQGSGAIYGIYVLQSYGTFNQPMNISNNCIISGYQGATGTTSYYGLYIGSSGLINVYNNTITKYSGPNNYPLLYITTGTLINVMNNNLTSYVGSQAMYVSSTIGLGMSDHNNFYTSAGSLIYYAGATFNDLSAYQTATGYDANSLSEDPSFQVAYECITCNEDLDNAGTVTGITVDIAGNVRSTVTPDIGAVEYVVGSSFNLGPDTTYCGNSFVLEAGPAQSIAWNVNSQISSADTVLLSTSGSTPMNFNVQVAVVTQYCGSGADVAVIRLVPNTHLDSTDHLCSGATTSLNAGGGSQATYIWSTGETTSTITIGDAGNYSVTKNEEGCESSASIAITKSTAVNIDDVEGCEADGDITIDATIPDGLNYAWSGGSSINTAVNSFGETGTYTITATDSYGCSSNDVFNVSFIDVPVPSITELHYGSTFFFSSATSLFAGNGATYFWDFGDGTTSTDANPVHGYTWSGVPETYNVTLTITNSCGEDVASSAVSFDIYGINDQFAKVVNVYPNPANDQVWIDLGSVYGHVSISLMDIAGRVVQDQVIESTNMTSLNTSDLSAGSYLLKVSADGQSSFTSLIIE